MSMVHIGFGHLDLQFCECDSMLTLSLNTIKLVNHMMLCHRLKECMMQVGCLEEVLQKMLQAEGKGDWGSVMFVPAGSISQSKK